MKTDHGVWWLQHVIQEHWVRIMIVVLHQSQQSQHYHQQPDFQQQSQLNIQHENQHQNQLTGHKEDSNTARAIYIPN